MTLSGTSLPTGTVTFLFTDIQGSTKLLQQLGERYPAVLEDHHRLLRGVFEANSGVEAGTEGDSFFVAFREVDDAVKAATSAQRVLAEHQWDFEGGLKVRIGIHTGKGSLSGDNYVGLDVHRASRISSAAHGGQILISGVTRSHVERMLPEGVRLKKIGTHRLKDLEHPEELFQLCINGLETDFPPPRTPDTRPNNLPTRLDRFVARERELKDIFDLLPHSRLITLTGPGGTGKTRLAFEVAYEKMLSFRDGTFVVLLAPLSDPQHVPSSVADALGIMEQGTTPIEESLREALEDKELLLVLDNFEQVAEAAPFVAELLAAARDIRILVTTRIPLRVRGEQEYPVPPMAVPDPERLPPLEQMQDYEAIDLFVERAKAVNPRFTLTKENAATVAEICRHLDGLPLAIELAAARTRVLGAEDILRRLEDGLGILSGGARDRPSRQQTLRNAIAWSYDLLEEPCARFFTRLGVFPGGWTFDTAETICNPDADVGIDSFEAMETLVDNSLVRSVPEDSGETRFRMLQTIREYAYELLEAGPDADLVGERHASHFCRMAQDAAPSVTQSTDAPDRLSAEHDNLRAALRWFIDHGDTEAALAMATSLWRFWHIRSHLAEGRRWLTEALAMPGSEAATRAKALLALGSVTYWQNDWPPTHRSYEEALVIARELGDLPLVAEASYNAGFLGLLQDEVESAKELFVEALDNFDRLDDRPGQANALWALGLAALRTGEYDRALEFCERSSTIFAELNDWFGKMLTEFIRYQHARLTGRLDQAEEMVLKQLEATSTTEDEATLSSIFEVLADIWIAQGKAAEGIRIAAASETVRKEVGGGAPPALLQLEDPREAARALLTSEEMAAAWSEGAAMTPAEAIAYVRKETGH